MRTKREPLVHYISPFGSPAYMTRAEAERHQVEDDRLWCLFQEANAQGAECITPRMREIGAPHYVVCPA